MGAVPGLKNGVDDILRTPWKKPVDDAPWFTIARGEVGQAEISGPKDNQRIDQYLKAVGLGPHEETPWCAAFVGWCLEKAGYPSTNSGLAKSYLHYGNPLSVPQPGCIVVLWRNSPDGPYGHVGFFVRFEGDNVVLLGGNQSNAVCEASYPKARVLGYRWPLELAKPIPTPVSSSTFFNEAVTHVLESEGGYSDNPADSGGPTNYGITLSVLKAWRKNNNLTAEDVKALDRSEAIEIYKANYWDSIQLDSITNRIAAIVIFDQAVNRGPQKAVKIAQTVLNQNFKTTLSIDGEIGPQTIKAINSTGDADFTFCFLYSVQQGYADICARDHTQIVFLKGWLNRTHALFDLIRKAK